MRERGGVNVNLKYIYSNPGVKVKPKKRDYLTVHVYINVYLYFQKSLQEGKVSFERIDRQTLRGYVDKCRFSQLEVYLRSSRLRKKNIFTIYISLV